MKTTETITCPRCDGSGSHSYNLTHGTVCFGCWGKGEVVRVVKPASQTRREDAKKAEKAAAAADRASRMNAIIEALEARYGNDPRMERCPSPQWRYSHLLELAQFDLSRQGIKIRDLLELEAHI